MNLDPGFIDSPTTHLAAELGRMQALLRWRIAVDRRSGRLPPRADARDRGFISADAVDALLSDTMSDPSPDVAAARSQADRLTATLRAHVARAREVGVPLPFEICAERFGLSALARDMFALTVLAEIDGGLRQAIGYLQNDITRQFPDLELCQSLFCPAFPDRLEARRELLPEAPLVRHGLLVLPLHHLADDLSVGRLPLRPARHVVDFLAGYDGVDPLLVEATHIDRQPAPASRLDRLIWPDTLRDTVQAALGRFEAATAQGLAPVLLVSGPEGTGKTLVCAAFAHRIGHSLMTVDARRIPTDMPDIWFRAFREALLRGASLHLQRAESLASELRQSLFAEIDRTPEVAVLLEAREGLAFEVTRPVHALQLPMPAHAERNAMWRFELQRRGLPRQLAAQLAGKYRVSGGTIAMTLDSLPASLAASPQKLMATVQERLSGVSDHRLGTLATRVHARASWSEVILPETTRTQLERLVAHFRHRTRIMVDWGFEARLATGHGISALFQGPPGTGKTLAASIIAREFDLELYQIDLSRIVSKWLGETEKNLATIFDEAERAHAILLFDEADSLFAKRTEVQSSNDRHANLEVNFLLQRMDAFRGITLLTSNFGKSIDEAFARRMTFRIDFPEPSAVERERLWECLMPQPMEREGPIDFGLLGRRFEMSGGHIRNAILKAAIEAASEDGAVTMRHLIAAGNQEYRAMGRLLREDV